MLNPASSQTFERVERYLETARLALEQNGDPDSAVSRAYYALYHATIVLLVVVGKLLGRKRWDHTQLHTEFLNHFCKKSYLFNLRDGEDWKLILEARLRADYWHRPLRQQDAADILRTSARLITRMKTEVIRYG